MSTNKPKPPTSSLDMEQHFLTPPGAITFPKFPTFSELVEAPPPEVRPKPSGLFEGLLGDPAALLEDVQRNPAKYEEGVSELLSSITQGLKPLADLNVAERGLLDRATLDYAQAPRREPPAAPPPSPPKQPEPTSQRAEKPEGPKPGRDVPETALKPFWWLS
jgi:hypothetical protein